MLVTSSDARAEACSHQNVKERCPWVLSLPRQAQDPGASQTAISEQKGADCSSDCENHVLGQFFIR